MASIDEQEFKALGQMITRRMQQLNWTIADLADCAGISHTTLVKLRSGLYGIGSRAIFPVCRILGIRFFATSNTKVAEYYVQRSPHDRRKQVEQKLPDGRRVRVAAGMQVVKGPKRPVLSDSKGSGL